MSEDSYDLARSSKKLGKLYPILKDKHGNVIDGFHRQNADPEWPVVIVESVDTPVKLEVARLAANFCRRQLNEQEIQNRLVFLRKNGMSVPEIAEQTGISEATIYRHLPAELKARSEAISEGRKEQVATATSQELREAEEKARSAIRECYNCKMGFREDQMKYVDGKAYCPGCFANASIAFKNEQKRLEKAKDQPVTPKSLDTAEEREARMHPHDSQFQIEVFTELAEEGLTFEQNQKLPVFETEPDGLRYLNEERTEGLLVYLDNVEVHKGKKIDTDERLRDQYRKHNPGVTILAIPYKGRSDKEKARVKGLIREKYEFLKAEHQKWKTDISQPEEES